MLYFEIRLMFVGCGVVMNVCIYIGWSYGDRKGLRIMSSFIEVIFKYILKVIFFLLRDVWFVSYIFVFLEIINYVN